ncbi:MAG: ATP-binding cassette domain-containing protein [Verrucomicrobiota bacterium]
MAISAVQTRGVDLRGINWQVFAGDFWAIAGLVGAGKSDFLSTAAGLQRPGHGIVRLFGEQTFTVPEEQLVEQRRKIGLVFSGGGRLFNRMTIAENVALPLRYHNNWGEDEAEKLVREMMEWTALEPFAHRQPALLHVHWQQRASLARALILKPELLLLDQPLAGMDFQHQEWWVDFLGKLAEGCPFYGGKKVTLVVTADNLAPWKNIARHFVVLKNNQWNELGGREALEARRGALREFFAGQN